MELSGDLVTGSASRSPSPARGIAGQVAANASLLIAVLVYMGWAFDDALYGYFHVAPLDLGVSIVEYMLRSLALFSPGVVVAAVGIIAVTAVHAGGLEQMGLARPAAGRITARLPAVPAFRRLVPAGDAGHLRGRLLAGAGASVTAVALVLASIASRIPVSTYLLLGLLGAGPLLLTWPIRGKRHGRFPYSLAVVVAAVCALWAASLYAHGIGIRAAQAFVRDLPSRTAVVVYSTQPLALSGPGVTVEQLPAGFLYHYRYKGLRLLTARSGTYYVVPVGWRSQLDLTYILNVSDQTRIELLSGAVRPNR